MYVTCNNLLIFIIITGKKDLIDLYIICTWMLFTIKFKSSVIGVCIIATGRIVCRTSPYINPLYDLSTKPGVFTLHFLPSFLN